MPSSVQARELRQIQPLRIKRENQPPLFHAHNSQKSIDPGIKMVPTDLTQDAAAKKIQTLFREYKFRQQYNSSYKLKEILRKNGKQVNDSKELKVNDVLVVVKEQFGKKRHSFESHAYIVLIKQTTPELIIDVLELDKPAYSGRRPEWEEAELRKNPLPPEPGKTSLGLAFRKLPRQNHPRIPDLFFCHHQNKKPCNQFPILQDITAKNTYKLYVTPQHVISGWHLEQARLKNYAQKLSQNKLLYGPKPQYGIYNCGNAVYGCVVAALYVLKKGIGTSKL